MKKYIAPEVEIKRFAVENIMTGSEVTPVQATVGEAKSVDALGTVNNSGTLDYNAIFGIN